MRARYEKTHALAKKTVLRRTIVRKQRASDGRTTRPADLTARLQRHEGSPRRPKLKPRLARLAARLPDVAAVAMQPTTAEHLVCPNRPRRWPSEEDKQ